MLQQTSNAQIVSTRDDARRSQRVLIQTVRGTIGCLAEQVSDLGRSIDKLTALMPEAGATFDVLSELGEGLRCVRNDLLADAIETLDTLANLGDTALQRRHQERQAWIVTETD